MQEKQEVEPTTVGFKGYSFLTVWSEEKGCYTTRVMQRPDLITEGDTAVGSLLEMEHMGIVTGKL